MCLGPLGKQDTSTISSANLEELSEDQASALHSLAHLSLKPDREVTDNKHVSETLAKVYYALTKQEDCGLGSQKNIQVPKPVQHICPKKLRKLQQSTQPKKKKKSENKLEELEHCLNPWKSKKMMAGTLKDERRKKDLAIENTRLLLNKLHRDNYHSISKKIYNLNWNENNVSDIFALIFTKASAESIFVQEYVAIIQNIYNMVSLTEDENRSNPNNGPLVKNTELMKLILQSINTGVKGVLERATNLVKYKTMIYETMDENDSNEFRNNLSTCLIFIAALFKQNFVETKQVLIICLSLIDETSDANLESLAVFLMKVGEKIDRTNKNKFAQCQWDLVVESVQSVVLYGTVSKKRTHFMLLDFIELKNRAWIPRTIPIPDAKLTTQGLIDQEKKRFKNVNNKKDVSQYYVQDLQYLNVTKQPWRRGAFKCKSFRQEPEIHHKLMIILNQINENNCDRVFSKFARKLRFKTETIDNCVDIVLHKCLQDSKFMDSYVKFFKLFANHKNERAVSKRRAEDLEVSVFISLVVNRSAQLITGPHTMKSAGLQNICFMLSELFKSNVCSPMIIFDVLITLLNQDDEQKLIYATKILFSCGEYLEKSAAQDEYKLELMKICSLIHVMCSFTRDKLSNRTYLMLSSVLILRDRNWTSNAQLDNIVNVTIGARKEKKLPRHIQRHQGLGRKEREEKSEEKDNLLQSKEAFLVKDILKDLDIVDNPWRRGEFIRELTESEKIIMAAKTLLNKLAENNFKSIVEQFSELKFTPDTVDPILNVLFVKAILETKFTELHAKFVKAVSDLWSSGNPGSENGSTGNGVMFDLKALLVEMCAMEIDSIHADCSLISAEIKYQKQANLATACETLEKRVRKTRKNVCLSEQYRELLKKKISVGTCHFLGELFNADVVDVNFILTTLLCDLLPYESEESIECGIKLISIVGKKLERVISRSRDENTEAGWNHVMENIARKAGQDNRERWSNRIYFMLLDLMDLRQRDWLPRIIIVPTRQFKVPKKSRGI